ncbi:MAG: hypothetical protein PHR77_22075, partial [Kiritimatiellae bacterium]|nr:hypothetical protein [Kiritimatiellia bacterium]
MNKKVLIVFVILIAAVFLVVRVAGKRGIKGIAEIKKPVTESKTESPETKSKVVSVSSTKTTQTENLPKLRISSVTKEDFDRINKMNPVMSVVMGTGDKTDYFTRIKAVHSLGKELSDNEVQALFVLLNRKKSEDPLQPDQLNAIKNDVVNALKVQANRPADLANNLMAMYYDKGHDGVWRDYCVQHLGSFYPKIDNTSEQKMVRDLFWVATREIDSSIAGTALIALANNMDQPDITKDAVANKALLLSEDPKCGELAKITSMQICAKLVEK